MTTKSNRGGKRPNAGCKADAAKKPTKVLQIRIPAGDYETIKKHSGYSAVRAALSQVAREIITITP